MDALLKNIYQHEAREKTKMAKRNLPQNPWHNILSRMV